MMNCPWGIGWNVLSSHFIENRFTLSKRINRVLRLVDEVVCAPFKDNQDFITDLLLLGICNAQEGMNPFNRFGQLKVTVEQALSPSYNLGLLWEPREDFSFGMVYQSSSKMRLKGKYFIDNERAPRELIRGLNSSATGSVFARVLGFPSSIPATESGLVAMDFEYPAHFQAGITYKIIPDLQINFDVGWTDYSAWDKFRFEFDRQVSALQIAKLLSSDISIPVWRCHLILPHHGAGELGLSILQLIA